MSEEVKYPLLQCPPLISQLPDLLQQDPDLAGKGLTKIIDISDRYPSHRSTSLARKGVERRTWEEHLGRAVYSEPW